MLYVPDGFAHGYLTLEDDSDVLYLVTSGYAPNSGRGARWDGMVRTAPTYRLLALDTVPPKPGLVRAPDGAAIVGERWMISPAGLGTLLAELPPPMLLGPVELADGTWNVGFGCAADATGEDVTSAGDWLATLRPG